MRSVAAYLLIVSVAFEMGAPGRGLSELGKLPALIEHYRQHVAADNKLSFRGFLALHYDNEAHHEKDPGTHHDLPFSQHQGSHLSFQQLFFTFPETFRPRGVDPQTPVRQPFALVHNEVLFPSSIWQPPRRA